MRVGVEVLKGLFVQVPAMCRVDPTAVAAMMRRADEQFTARREHAPRFLTELNQVDRQMLDKILGNDDVHRIVAPWPGYLV